tara:strand:- start:2126 stop:3043 length:918 start_codon:yes stop_codon:yes gene_type:complete
MNVISGPSIADLCDYDFGDQAGVVGQVYGAFMKNASYTNKEFVTFVNESHKNILTLFIDNIRLYNREIKCNNDSDQRWVDDLQLNNDLMKLCASLDKKFIVFCNNEDTPIDSDINIPPNVLGVYGANAIGTNKKLHPLPYGVGRRLHVQDNRQDVLIDAMATDPKPRKLLYINHSEHTNLSERGNIRDMFSQVHYATVGERKEYRYYLKDIQDHKFMICPEGNAVDCHRNWEVLYMKRVPIMKRNSYLEKLYHNYPVLWVNDYGTITKTMLAEHDDLSIKARNLDVNMLHLHSIFNRAVNRAKNT